MNPLVDTLGIIKTCFSCGNFFTAENLRICSICRTRRRRERGVRSELKSLYLTFREKQIVNLVSQAKLNKEIAFELRLTEGTIKEYLNRIFRKLQVKNRTELALWALRNDMKVA
jgi:DNA-binding NarL/FixJ family response regulator